ncbi:DMT family transporter [Psychroflexus sediminis]|uniref:Permease of the drug/metabolite transporter (DMT) superfamily n=1 Tax=Psychroflexus sediminis TaxID=470826 RepID=A0A1G7V821_9FLAO|nr:DMT family transporter [Psychroflexus sediminis]SDG55884.1 Permease of the drug/metabolite transporter (DMT) superfamily [Psychroflexus sediminis]
MTKKTLLLVLGFVLFWNSGFVGAEYGLRYADPFTQLFWRYLGLTLLLGLFLSFRGRLKWIGWKQAKPSFLVGILAHGVWLSCALLAIAKAVPAGIVALIIALQPLATGALSGWVTGEHTSTRQWLGLGIGFLGVVLSVAYRIDMENSSAFWAYFLPFGAVIAMTIASLYRRHRELNSSITKLPMALSLFYQCLGTTGVLLLPAVVVENLETRWTPEFILTLTWLIAGVSLLAYLLMWKLIERMSATKVASLFYLGPPVTMLMAWLMFGDAILVWDLLGLAVILIGLLITQVNFRKRLDQLKQYI